MVILTVQTSKITIAMIVISSMHTHLEDKFDEYVYQIAPFKKSFDSFEPSTSCSDIEAFESDTVRRKFCANNGLQADRNLFTRIYAKSCSLTCCTRYFKRLGKH
jgi:hypothetical protein